MAKRKKKKEEKKETSYKTELYGLFLVLCAIIGIGEFGIIGKAIVAFASFLAGAYGKVILALVFIDGLYRIIKRTKPKYFTSSRLWGLYLILIAVLVLAHTSYLKGGTETIKDVWNHTYTNFITAIQNIKKPEYSYVVGGGIIGGIFTSLLLSLFDYTGAYVVNAIICATGIIILFKINIAALFTGISIFFKKIWTLKDRKKDKEEIIEAEEEYENGPKVVKTLDEIKAPKQEEVKETKPLIENMDTSGYMYPPITLLKKNPKTKDNTNDVYAKSNIPVLEQVFKDFGIEGAKVISYHCGPAVTQYELEIKSGTKVSRILGLNKEIALAMAAKDVRIEAPIPGKKTVGVEVPNKNLMGVLLREVLENFPNKDSKLLVALGKDIMGMPKATEINKMPHLLVSGTTGSGKSVCINSFIISILMRTKPDEVKLVLVDPKKVELSCYNGVPHLLTPVVTDPKKANVALKKIVTEMERRYDEFERTGNKNIAGYNMYIEKQNKVLPEEEKLHKMPFIVVIIDELADLMLVAAKEVEDSIMRITQMARAAGIHLIVATQRPSTDVITGLIKANIPSRIAFAVSSGIDSRTILDATGAEKLLGKGDMLFFPIGDSTPTRVQGTFVSEDEIAAVVDHVIRQQKAHYDETFLMDDEEMGAKSSFDQTDDYDEPLYNQIVEFVVEQGKASASLLQRKFRLGYNRAARAIDILEERGIIGPNNGSKPREVLVKLGSKEE
ncbi:MAG: DNA translocase FtsK [Firmicutes bacterium]|nr:DNA translocase FtsK [Bacillota bacterium]